MCVSKYNEKNLANLILFVYWQSNFKITRYLLEFPNDTVSNMLPPETQALSVAGKVLEKVEAKGKHVT